MSSAATTVTNDAAMIAAGQAAEHYEITRYGTLVSWAKLLGHKDAAMILEKTLKEEYVADDKLTKLAESDDLTRIRTITAACMLTSPRG